MFKNLKTSTQISLKFTMFSAAILLVVALIVNVFFFYSWYSEVRDPTIAKIDLFSWLGDNEDRNFPKKEEIIGNREFPGKNSLQEGTDISSFQEKASQGKFSPEQKFPRHEIRLNIDSEEAQELIKKDKYFNITVVDGYYLYFNKIGDQLLIRNVTSQLQLQHSLFWISVLVFVLGSILSYIISLRFVKTSLKKLNTLNEALGHLDIDHLDKKIEIDGAEDDEINKVIKVFNQTIEKIHVQALGLKDFVRNASHELRTPLMGISTLIDVARKSKDYEGTLIEVKEEIKRMDGLLETLLLITRIEEKICLEKEEIDIVPSLKNTLLQLEEEFKEKKISVKKTIPHHLEKSVHQQGRESIMTNLLRNAFKYTDEQGKITVELNDDSFKVWNSGKGITKDNMKKIRERFWQGDTSHSDSKSFGLGLYLSRLFAEKQSFNLKCESEKGKGATFILTFSN